ncbi:MAG: hypothetical protein K1X67_14515 [Fimbriimonadaceae bacterium]|nr:hypothetical protein [Fimbriimonadaceae bacterium]
MDRDEYERRKEGYRLMEEARRARIRETVTKEIIPLYNKAFEIARQKPLRTTCGLVEWYRILMKTRK